MKSAIVIVAALASIAAASPAPTNVARQLPDISSVDSAPAVAIIGPPLDASNQTNVYASVSAISAASAAATAVVTSVSNATTIQQRGLLADILQDLNNLWGRNSKKSSTSSSTGYTAPTPSPSTSVSNTASATTSSSTACATQPEAGTYCGFINPEDACAPQPDGYGPHPSPDTVAAFEAYPEFHKDALDAVTPKGYANTFKDLNASVSANSYLGLHTLSSYDVPGCSQWCDNTTLCTGFNIYIERDPALNPTSGNVSIGQYCPNPSSITNYKCTLWGSGVDAQAATNFGGYRDEFQVVIAGSNGYEKTNNTTPAQCSGWKPPQSCGGGAINKPSSALCSHFFPGPFNPQVCATYALAQTAKNKAAAKAGDKYLPCNFFNAYMMKRNGKAQGTFCSLYTEKVDNSYATYTGGWSGNDCFQIESSWSFELTQQDSGVKGS